MISELLASVPELLDHIDQTVVSVNGLIITLDRSLQGDPGAGPVGGILVDTDGLLAESEELIGRLSSLVGQLEEAENLIPALVGTEGVAGGLFSDEADFYLRLTGLTDEVMVSLNHLAGMTGSLNSMSPKMDLILSKLTTTLDRAQDVMEGLKNNPLLKGGIEENKEVPSSGGASLRNEEF